MLPCAFTLPSGGSQGSKISFAELHFSVALVSNLLQGLYGVAEVPLCVFVVRHIWILILGEVELKFFSLPYGIVLFPKQIGFLHCAAEAFNKPNFITIVLLRK